MGCINAWRSPLFVFAFVIAIALLSISITTATKSPTTIVDLQGITHTASLKYVPQTRHATLGLDDSVPTDVTVLELTVKKTDKNPKVLSSHSLLSDNAAITMVLRPSGDLLSADYEEVIHDIEAPDQQLAIQRVTNISADEIRENSRNCLYQGTLRGVPDSSVSISTCNGQLTGWIRSGNESYSIENNSVQNELRNTSVEGSTASTFKRQSFNILAQQKALALSGNMKELAAMINEVSLVNVDEEGRLVREHDGVKESCAVQAENRVPDSELLKIGYSLEELEEQRAQRERGHTDRVLGDDNIQKETPEKDFAVQQSGRPTRYIKIVFYHDYRRLQSYNTSYAMTTADLIDQARENSLEIFNNMASFYAKSGFNYDIVLVLTGHVFFSNGDPYTKYLHRNGGILVTTGYGLLENFGKYRSYYGHNGHDIGVLLSGEPFMMNIKGVANIGSFCTSSRYNGNINSVTYRNVVLNSVLIAHEAGHVLSAQHDEGDSRWIMYPYVVSSTTFSPYSKRNVNYHLRSTRCSRYDPRPASALQYAYNIGENETDLPVSFIYGANISPKDRFAEGDQHFLSTHQEFALAGDDIGSKATRYQQQYATSSPVTVDNVASPSLKASGLTKSELIGIICAAAIATSALTGIALLMAFTAWRKFNPPVHDKQLEQNVIPGNGSSPHVSKQTRDGNMPTAPYTPKLKPRSIDEITSSINDSQQTPREQQPPLSPYLESTRQRNPIYEDIRETKQQH